MASYTISPIWGAGAQLFDNNGSPLSGGQVYTYLAGTSTPAVTYTNPIGTIANSNPIIANAAGRLTNEIWFPVSGSYKFVLKDANDVLLATYDNIPTTPQPPIVNDASSVAYEPGYEVTAGNFTIGATYLITSVGNTDFVAIGAGANVTGIHFTATGVGSGTGTAEYTRTVQEKLRETISVADFGSGQEAIVNAVEKINSLGGGRLLFNGTSYSIATVFGQTLFSFENCDGLELDFTGSFFTDTTNYISSNATGYIFKFTDCTGVKFTGSLSGTANSYTGSQDGYGASWCGFLGNCVDLDLSLNVTGGSRGIHFSGTSATATLLRSRNIKANINTVNTSYPYLAGFSGDNAEIKLSCNNSLRDFFIACSTNVNLNVIAKNQRATALIKAYEGKGNDTIFVKYYNRDTTFAYSPAPVIAIEFGDITPGWNRNINIELDTKVNAASPWNGTVAFGKFDNSNNPDNVGRGHIFENIKITGVSDNTGANVGHVYSNGGSLTSPDVARNIIVEDFVGIAGNIQPGIFYANALEGNLVWKNVVCQGNMNPGQTDSESMITLIGCSAYNFTTTTADTGYHIYINSRITDATLQSIINKTFINTYYQLSQNNRTTLGAGFSLTSANKTIFGNLTGTTTAFKVTRPVGSGATNCMFRLKYYLVADIADVDPSTRDETYGIKSFSGAVDTSGVWASFTTEADEVTERTKGTASVFTINLLNGDSTGAYIQVSCSNYNGVRALGVFEIEMTSQDTAVILEQ